MRVWSTPQSVRLGEPTLLAILETLGAMAISAWLGVRFGTWKHVLIGFCIAPFLLLRTDASSERAIQWFAKGGAGIEKLADRNDAMLLLMLPWLLMAPILRALGTITDLLHDPI